MQRGSFYCFVPRKSSVAGWLPFTKANQKVLRKRFDALLNREVSSLQPTDELIRAGGGRGGVGEGGGGPGPEPGAGSSPAALLADPLDPSSVRTGSSFPGAAPIHRDHPRLGLPPLHRVHRRNSSSSCWGSHQNPQEEDPQGCFHDAESGTDTYMLLGGAISVCHAWIEFGGELCRMQPHVYRDERAIIVFDGHLSNLDDLLLRMGGGRGKEVYRALRSGSFDGSLMPAQLNLDKGSLTSRLLLRMFLDHRDRDPLLMLSELQGHYSFVIYDSSHRQVFAARDPVGREPLYYHVDPDEGVAFTNQPMNVPDAQQESEWIVIPPGHFVAGKTPKLQQFALTREQLQRVKSREFAELPIDEDWSLSSGSPTGSSGFFGSLGLPNPFSQRKSGQIDETWLAGSY